MVTLLVAENEKHKRGQQHNSYSHSTQGPDDDCSCSFVLWNLLLISFAPEKSSNYVRQIFLGVLELRFYLRFSVDIRSELFHSCEATNERERVSIECISILTVV